MSINKDLFYPSDDETIYLPSKLFYTLPCDEDYQHTKRAYLSEQAPDYTTKSTTEQWAFLILKLQQSLQPQHIPNTQTLDTMIAFLDTFRDNRQRSIQDENTLSLQQCVGYFEDIFFIYTSQDPRFQVSNIAKKSILQSILEAEICPTGVNGQLYALLQEHQKDSDWIKTELTKARCEKVRYLEQTFGVAHQSSKVLGFHIYNALIDLANQAHLGIKRKEAIIDNILTFFNYFIDYPIKHFFDHQHPIVFQAYEREAIQTLTTYVMSEMSAVMNANSAWQQDPITLSTDSINFLDQLLTRHFPGLLSKDELYRFLKISDDGMTTQLIAQPACASAIQSLISKKLLADGYYIPVRDLAADAALRGNLRCWQGHDASDIVTLHQALEAQKLTVLDHKASQRLIKTYPEMLLNYIRHHPEVLSTIPKHYFKDPLLTGGVINVLIQRLSIAVTQDDMSTIDCVTTDLNTLSEADNDYLELISPELLALPSVAQALIKKNSLWSVYLPITQETSLAALGVRPTPDFLAISTDAARIQTLQNLLSSLPPSIQSHPSILEHSLISGKPVHIQMHKIALFKSLRVLVSTPHIDPTTFLTHVQQITPDLLHQAILYRQTAAMSPLPFCQSPKVNHYLTRFASDIHKRIPNGWNNSYLSLKIAAIHDLNEPHSLMAYLASSPDWFSGFLQYQGHQLNPTDRWLCLKSSLKAPLYLLAVYLLYQSFWMVIPFVTTIVNACFWPALGLFLILLTVNALKKNTLELKKFILLYCLFTCLDWIVAALWIIAGIAITIRAVQSANEFIHNTLNNLSLYIHSQRKLDRHGSKAERCQELIQRLAMLEDDPSAQQKSEILQVLFDKIISAEADINQETLQLKHAMTFQGQDYQVSFADVAAQRRSKNTAFSLAPQTPPWYGFFCPQTTSNQLLDAALPTLT